MEKKTIFLELPVEMVDRIDRQNMLGDRSVFISDLIGRQLQQDISTMDVSSGLTSRMKEPGESLGLSGEIGLVDSKGHSLGKFGINTIEGFEELAKKISEVSDDPIVRMKARHWL